MWKQISNLPNAKIEIKESFYRRPSRRRVDNMLLHSYRSRPLSVRW